MRVTPARPCLRPMSCSNQKCGERALSPFQPHCVCVCVLALGICLLSHVARLVLSTYERCHPEVGGGDVFPFSHHFQERRGGLFPSRVVCDPKEEKEGCCHGGLCEANSSRVKWEIFIPRVRQRAAASGQSSRAGYCRHSEAVVCGQVGLWACPGCLVP